MHISKPLSVFALLGLAAAAPGRIAARQDCESPAAWNQWNPSPSSPSAASGGPSPAGGKPSPSSGSPSSGSSSGGSPSSGSPSGGSPAGGSPSPAGGSPTPAYGSPTPAYGSPTPAGGSPTTSSGAPTATCSSVPPGTTYTVVSGDTLSKIAESYCVGICDIQAANAEQITNVNNIFPGEVLKIPSGISSKDNTSCLPPPAKPCVSTGQLSYTVVSGDTLTSIADHFTITLQSLENANQQVTNPDLIEVGQILNLPQCICPSS